MRQNRRALGGLLIAGQRGRLGAGAFAADALEVHQGDPDQGTRDGIQHDVMSVAFSPGTLSAETLTRR
jgi:hypothetical protein